MGQTSLPQVTITPGMRSPKFILAEFWDYRDLLYFFVWRDVKVRYKQTALGVLWAILQPMATMVVFTLIFGRLAGISSGTVPYSVFSYTGLLLWSFFSQGLTQSAMSLVNSADLVRKVYFPRVFVPVSSVVHGIVDLAIAIPILVLLMRFYGMRLSLMSLIAPAFILIAMAACLGVGLWLSALSVRYRDFRYVVPFLTQLWLFITPVIYPTTLVSNRIRDSSIPTWVFGLNPMAGAIEGFRWCLLGEPHPIWPLIVASALVSLVLLITGWFVFNFLERAMADVV